MTIILVIRISQGIIGRQPGRIIGCRGGGAQPLPHLPERPVRACRGGTLLEFLQARTPSVSSSFPSSRTLFMRASTATTDTQLRQASMPTSHMLAGGLAPPDLDVLLRVRLGLSGLHAPVSLGVSTVSSRPPMNNGRWPRLDGSPLLR
jgi:hypothetical protein